MRGSILFFPIGCAGLFLSSSLAVRAEASTIEATPIGSSSNNSNEVGYRYTEDQYRRKTWDVFGVLLMMINSECGPGGAVHLPDCRLLHGCNAGRSADCDTLCGKKNDPHKSSYGGFCDSGSSSSSSSSYAADGSSVDAYSGETNPGSFVTGGSRSAAFRFWMVAVAASVGTALAAIHVGQRRGRHGGGDNGGARGSVGRRVAAVAALADGVLGGGRHGVGGMELAGTRGTDSSLV
eukprot:CAMPEP_0201274964 /NCGR_PEP_ID=MMETSP0853-20130426/51061_1 /ASSEMBLY_ACC=CAM_ASM_000640 /TAXON_ID=183588 /ORGANISM="Pseudo-nitzschia fraudulenta, Strain WWA7" /LENGTH=235 /DNA_ID=CAMNT_0047582475 /DNA_START=206 /DNA_END=913 /DNA_ORIENTATION=+